MTPHDWFTQATFLLVLFNYGLIAWCIKNLYKAKRSLNRIQELADEDVQWVSPNGQDPFEVKRNQPKRSQDN